jgi:hypothetical protein
VSAGVVSISKLGSSSVAGFCGRHQGDEETGFFSVEQALPVFQLWRERHDEVLLIVDQFEELFTLNTDEVHAHFAELLGRAANETKVRVLISLRDDFLIHCHDHDALAPVFESLTPLKPPKGAALRWVLVEPARKQGYAFEDDQLVEAMLSEVSGKRGALPLLADTTDPEGQEPSHQIEIIHESLLKN